VGGPLASDDDSNIRCSHPSCECRCEQLLWNQRSGTVHGPLPDSANQVRVHVRGDGNRRMAKQLRHGADVAPPASINDAQVCRSPWKVSFGSGSPSLQIAANCRVRWFGSSARPSSIVKTCPCVCHASWSASASSYCLSFQCQQRSDGTVAQGTVRRPERVLVVVSSMRPSTPLTLPGYLGPIPTCPN
jgi:hypothetical protein